MIHGTITFSTDEEGNIFITPEYFPDPDNTNPNHMIMSSVMDAMEGFINTLGGHRLDDDVDIGTSGGGLEVEE